MLLAASLGGVVVIVFVIVAVLLGLGYGFTRQGSGVSQHPLGGRRRADEPSGQSPGAGEQGDPTSAADQQPKDA